MAYDNLVAYQGAANEIAANSNLQGIAFSQRALAASLIEDPYGRLEGEGGTGAAITVKRGLVGKGTQLVKMPISGYLGAGVRRAEAQLKGSEETVPMNSVTVKAAVRRHAVGTSEQFAEFVAGGSDVNTMKAKLLGHHFGWMKSHEAGLKLRNSAELASNVYFANGKSSIETIRGTDVITYAEVVRAHYWADQEAHIEPANLNAIAADSSNVSKVTLFGPLGCFTQLKTDSSYLTLVQNADVRGIGKNVAFTGQFADLDGVALRTYKTLSPNETAGIIGDPLCPEVRLSQEPTYTATAAINALNSAGSHTDIVLYSSRGVDSTTGYATNNTIYENFSLMPAHLYTYDPLDTSAGTTAITLFGTAATARFALIYDKTDGLCTMCRYVQSSFGTRGNTLTVTRLTSSNTTLTGGNVTYNTGIWSGKMKSTGFMPGSIMIPCNSYGQALCFPQILGAGALTRVYGRDFESINESDDYGEFRGLGYRTVFGSEINRSAFGPPRGYVQIVAARSLPSWNLPTVV